MISFNENDYFLPSIKAESKFNTLVVQKHYRVFGLKNQDNPPVIFRWGENALDESKIGHLYLMFKRSGLPVDFYRDYPKGISVGLRRDVRENVPFASALLQTIVYYMENKIELPKDFRIPMVKKFQRNGNITPPPGSESSTPYDMTRILEYYGIPSQ
jgi:hypothetical protein